MPLDKQLKPGWSAQIIELPSKTEVKKLHQGDTSFDLVAKKKKARTAYDNAKYRCKKDPSYSTTKFLFQSYQEFLDHAGLPKTGDVSLDRINPNGHYEPGNVRWVSTAIQAINKKKSKIGSVSSIASMQHHYGQQAQQAELRAKVAVAWGITVRMFNRGALTQSEATWFLENPAASGILEANFDITTVHDSGCATSGILHMPSLTVPGGRIRLRAGPLRNVEPPEQYRRNGVLFDLTFRVLLENLSSAEVADVKQDVEKAKGVAFIGPPSTEAGVVYGIEARMMAVAARLNALGRRAAIFPALTIVEILKGLGNVGLWGTVSHPVLDHDYLFIPDYQIEQGKGFELNPKDQFRLADLLEYRTERSLPSWVGIQNPIGLNEPAKKLIFRNFKVRELGKTAIKHPCPEEVVLEPAPHRSLKGGMFALKDLEDFEGFQFLKKPMGFFYN